MKIILASVQCHGIRGKDRKVKFHSEDLQEYAADAIDRIEAKRLAQAWLADMKKIEGVPKLFFRKGEIDGPFRTISYDLSDIGIPI